MQKKIILNSGELTLADLHAMLHATTTIELPKSAHKKIAAAHAVLKKVLKENRTVYGINTGFGSLANTRISDHQLEELQRNLILSHAAGTGELLSDEIVRLILILKINVLAQGYSGVRQEVVDDLLTLVNQQVYPCIPSKGSVGACGDLAPLAHMTCALLGVGDMRQQQKIISAKKGLAFAELKPITLQPKEGLSLINGTQASCAVAISALFKIENIFAAAVVAGSLSLDAALGSVKPFDDRLQQVRRQRGSIQVAAMYRELINASELHASHANCTKVQDPYSLRCQPQIMGACFDHIQYAAKILENEANAISDNPIVFSETHEVISGGNFHAETVAMTADTLALAFAEIGSLSERIIALLIDTRSSGLPAFLIKESGLNSGFMMAHVTAAALASENKSLAHPASVDSIPTSAYQEDHVSMAMFAANRLQTMAENTATIVAIELLAACQGIDLRKPLKTSKPLQHVLNLVREHVLFYEQDRFFAPDIEKIKQLVLRGEFKQFIKQAILKDKG